MFIAASHKSCFSIFFYFTHLFGITFIANRNPVYLCRTRNTSPKVPLPSLLPISKSFFEWEWKPNFPDDLYFERMKSTLGFEPENLN